MRKILANKKGFTLIEIIAVLIILGILAAVAVPKFMSLQADAERKSISGVKAELQARANQYYAQYLLDNAITTNAQACTDWGAETVGADFTLSGGVTVTVAASSNQYTIACTPGVNATDGTGAAAVFGVITEI